MAIHVGDIGTTLVMTCTDNGVAVDISLAVPAVMFLLPPDGSGISKPASFTTDGTDGQMEITASEWIQAGEWKAQGFVIMPSGTFRGDINRFCVEASL